MNIKIAIADDNSFLIKAVKEKLSFFKDLECKFIALNGSELISKLEDNSNIDLILMDIEMPKMNGIEATSKVKKKFPHIKIIMLTVFDNDENIFNAIKYAEASVISVSIHYKNDVIEIEINDDGKGFDIANVELGNGINNMKKRAEEIKAKLIIDSLENKGTQIKLTM